MGLFDKKKDKKEERAVSDDFDNQSLDKLMPNLPELPSYGQKKSNFPSYESEIGSIKAEVGGTPKVMGINSDIPLRKPQMTPMGIRMPVMSGGSMGPQSMPPSRPMPARAIGGKPVFIKIDKYRDALDNLEIIKELCKNADSLLNEINRLREEENRELEKWRDDIGKIKDRLLMVDKKLFEG
ncbi:MAG: hypothetical protein ABIH25_01390 [Candidatus Woesearchaeota archaeon]